MVSIMETATRHFVRPEHLNHHHSLYAGCISEWMTEASFVAVAKLLGRTDHVVLAAVKEIQIHKPMVAGMVLEINYCLKSLGTTSIEIQLEGRDDLSRELHCQGSVVFVTVDDEGKKTPHTLKENGDGN